MIKHVCKTNILQMCFVIIFLLMSPNSYAEPVWHLYKNKNGVRVFYQNSSDNTFKVKAQMSVNSISTYDFLALLSDTKTAPKWLENVSQVKTIKYISPSENLVYSYINSPWPVRDRDSITHTCYSQLTANKSQLLINARPNELPKNDGVIRITTLNARWLLTESKDQLTIEYQLYALPGGAIPTWLSNKVGLKSTYNTFVSLRYLLTHKKYTPTPPIIKTGKC
ncbi:START domain-containing protein [Pseudoalteromonas sp. MMG006]|uniref:START domain-containing protein n=1 Tax=Pseudoalteromonas sp. MMG006 TaxID=2822683 RepID=UPI001B36B372|nr:START domain-containing protein [Pseudoalteromonas sp. MMG006]MBQ4798056.1 START domain-containing protein [Pseudoalteromonas sp. MMG006]